MINDYILHSDAATATTASAAGHKLRIKYVENTFVPIIRIHSYGRD